VNVDQRSQGTQVPTSPGWASPRHPGWTTSGQSPATRARVDNDNNARAVVGGSTTGRRAQDDPEVGP